MSDYSETSCSLDKAEFDIQTPLHSGPGSICSLVERARLDAVAGAEQKTKHSLAQFFTPIKVAQFMASMFAPVSARYCRLLDPGAGVGSLTAAFMNRWGEDGKHFDHFDIDMFELDPTLHRYLSQTIEACCKDKKVTAKVQLADFVYEAADVLLGHIYGSPSPSEYTHVIMNPPYKKIHSSSEHRQLLRRCGIESVNLYAAFVDLSLRLLADGGQLVAIIPRSFCNGPYYHPFRKSILNRTAICHIHLFDSRNRAFRDDGVLQENVIIRLARAKQPPLITVSTSTDGTFSDLRSHQYPFDQIVIPGDDGQFIHVPQSPESSPFHLPSALCSSLSDIGVSVSTGPVVDFRLNAFLCDSPQPGAVPLLYPVHFGNHGATWPVIGTKKKNAILQHPDTEKWLFPLGFYCVVRRFSAKEEKRRIVASVVDPVNFGGAPKLGFENHLNVYHCNRQSLPESLARGLSVYLNSSIVDAFFRRFSGHTQVNATDLRLIKYPGRATLSALGRWAKRQRCLSQAAIDLKIEEITR